MTTPANLASALTLVGGSEHLEAGHLLEVPDGIIVNLEHAERLLLAPAEHPLVLLRQAVPTRPLENVLRNTCRRVRERCR